ncbi:uncharacterized protein DBV15_10451 [Temnothorax longispinosus]|uniref:Transposable element P transposase n=1 Tax=Temnothorax longispinosus TaxID=300112 RepID=A0A4S2L463_9HYME|nr:uncharacterized protein DBV15_10451 [Temnothorax longispinosus]
MRVSNATRVFCEELSSGLQYLVNNNYSDERLTTAWFIDFMARWFHIMSSRNIGIALSHERPEKYNEAIEFLEEAIELFTCMKVGNDGRWKPFQTALIISTKTVIELSKDLLSNGFTFFLASRLTQDCLENLFSIIRLKNVIPNALQFKNNLKLITISQFMKPICKSNYHEDDRQFLSEFLDILLKNRSVNSHFLTSNTSSFEPLISNQRQNLSQTELNVLYHIAGYIVANIHKNQKMQSSAANIHPALKKKFKI